VAKRFCWEQKNEAQLLLVSNDEENDFFSRKVAQTGSKSFWLRINDQKNEGQWVVDRRGYSKPKTWSAQEYFRWDENYPNGEIENSAVIMPDGSWIRNDKFAVSEFACQGDFVELDDEPDAAKQGRLLDGEGAGRNYNVDTVEGAADLKCWTCDAKNYNECQATGTLKACLPNEKSCELEVRTRWGWAGRVISGCKAADACANNKAQNFIGGEDQTQCRPESKYRHSVCRQCCFDDSCTKNLKPSNRAEWAQNL